MATYGLRIRNPETGRDMLNISTRLTRIINTAYGTGTSDGYVDMSPYGGIPCFQFIDLDCYNQRLTAPSVWVDGSLIRWSFNGIGANYRKSATLLLMVT